MIALILASGLACGFAVVRVLAALEASAQADFARDVERIYHRNPEQSRGGAL